MADEKIDFEFKPCEASPCAFCKKNVVESGISVNTGDVVPLCSSCERTIDQMYFLLAANKIIRYRVNLECSLDVAIRDLFPETIAELLLCSNKDLMSQYYSASESEN